MKYMFFLCCCLLVSGVGILQATTPYIIADDYVTPGNVLQVIIPGDHLSHISLSIENSRKESLSRNEGFLWTNPSGKSVAIVLLGIPSTIDAGQFTLVMDAVQGKVQWHLEKKIIVTEKFFPEEKINLSDKMNTLLSDDPERKKAEARKLWSILSSFNETAVFHTGIFIPPLANGVPTAGFGDRRRFYRPDGSEFSSIHFGLDLWSETDTPVKCAGRGRVVLATERLLTGNTVIIEHLPGVYSLYYHMNSLTVGEGEMVSQGKTIGSVGKTGFATGEHLHWELRTGAVSVDPSQFFTIPLLDTNHIISSME